jgi:hypothetical protein
MRLVLQCGHSGIAVESITRTSCRRCNKSNVPDAGGAVNGTDNRPVFTDGKHVVFRMTETREADVVREILAGYKGVLVSDFYPGCDAIPCRQQKCLVHLIRDINDDLWKAPFDKELEAFAVEVQALLVPILVEVDRYGLKAWRLRKFLKDVERFYDKHIIGREYTSGPVRARRPRSKLRHYQNAGLFPRISCCNSTKAPKGSASETDHGSRRLASFVREQRS